MFIPVQSSKYPANCSFISVFKNKIVKKINWREKKSEKNVQHTKPINVLRVIPCACAKYHRSNTCRYRLPNIKDIRLLSYLNFFTVLSRPPS